MQAFVPKHRRPKFELHLKVIDLNNVPLVSGTAYIKWHLPSSASAEHRGRTGKSIIKDHRVQWNYHKIIAVRLTVDKNQMLQESDIHFEVLQEYSSDARGERIILGHVRLNLAEYVEANTAASESEREEGITRRYLMQDSKINSTLKISIGLKQIEGDKHFVAPPLKSAPVFGGIAGIISGEQMEQEEAGNLNPLNFRVSENRELQDMYRRTLAASFAAQAGELPADECIESIFAGGDGWRDGHEPPQSERAERRSRGSTITAADSPRQPPRDQQHRYPRRHERRRSTAGTAGGGGGGSGGGGGELSRGSSRSASRESLRQSSMDRARDGRGDRHADGNAGGGGGGGGGGQHSSPRGQVDEFEARGDLRSWIVSVNDGSN
ncbi:MAG: hypothetical protein M1826_001489 [Phylliscum demangeonii]|nr:MAG: hypothetical protein M1826_001489 [Phylliscum demangeonii]